MTNYFKMKKNERKVKAALYGATAAVLDNRKDILELIQKIYLSLKDIPTEELQDALVSRLIELSASAK